MSSVNVFVLFFMRQIHKPKVLLENSIDFENPLACPLIF